MAIKNFVLSTKNALFPKKDYRKEKEKGEIGKKQMTWILCLHWYKHSFQPGL